MKSKISKRFKKLKDLQIDKKVESIDEMPTSYKEGSLFVSQSNRMRWD